jgi:hypothetical protein
MRKLQLWHIVCFVAKLQSNSKKINFVFFLYLPIPIVLCGIGKSKFDACRVSPVVIVTLTSKPDCTGSNPVECRFLYDEYVRTVGNGAPSSLPTPDGTMA